MDEVEFDKFAEEYNDLTEGVLGPSGEGSAFFAEYKIQDTARLINKLGLSSKITVLDFGSGIGTSIPWLKKHLPNCQLHGIDISRKSLAISEHRFSNLAKLTHFDGKSLPFSDDKFDLVFSACVFHHIAPREHDRLLAELRRVLKPGGVFISFEHNPYNFLTVRAVNACRYDENAILIRGNEFKQKLELAGFYDANIRYRIFFPHFLRALRPLEKFMTWLPLGAQYYVYVQKPT